MGNIILMAEKAKGAVDEEAEVYEFEGMDALIRFRKKFPEKMKYEYHYILSGGTKNCKLQCLHHCQSVKGHMGNNG